MTMQAQATQVEANAWRSGARRRRATPGSWLRRGLETHISLPLFALLLLVAIWMVTNHFVHSERTAADNAARDSVHELIDTYEAQLARNLGGIDQTLDRDEQLAPFAKRGRTYLWMATMASVLLILVVTVVCVWSWRLTGTQRRIRRAQAPMRPPRKRASTAFSSCAACSTRTARSSTS